MPRYGVEREYAAEVENPVDAEALAAQLRAGVETTEDGEPFVVRRTPATAAQSAFFGAFNYGASGVAVVFSNAL